VPVFDGKLLVMIVDRRPWCTSRISRRVVAGLSVEGLEPPVVEDEELDAAECAGEAGITAVAARQRQIAEQLGDALGYSGTHLQEWRVRSQL
jgi:hypothetical protein